jgi:hypothetical protein
MQAATSKGTVLVTYDILSSLNEYKKVSTLFQEAS